MVQAPPDAGCEVGQTLATYDPAQLSADLLEQLQPGTVTT